MHAIYNGFKRTCKLGLLKICLFLKFKKKKKKKKKKF